MNQLKTPQAFVRRFDAVRARLLQVQIARALLQALLVVMAGLALLAAADYLWEAPRLLRQIGEQLAQRRQVSHSGLALSARHSPGPGALSGAACLVGEVAGHHAAQPRSPGQADVLADVRADRRIRAGARLRILRHRNHPLPSDLPA